MRLLITGAWKCSEKAVGALESAGYETVFMQDEKSEIPVFPESIDAVVCNGLFLYHGIEKFSRLKIVQLTSAGFDRIPMDQIKTNGIALFGAGDVYSHPIAETVIGGVLQLYREFEFFSVNRKKHLWEKKRTLRQLGGKKICVIGCGSIGKHTAKLFSAFGCCVYGVDLKKLTDENFVDIFPPQEMKAVLGNADVTVVTVPLTDENYHLMDKSVFAAMKPGSIFVNVSRGAVADEDALAEALEKRLGGAVLDVFEREPLSPESKLWELPNVIIIPHCAFISDRNHEELEAVILKNLLSVVKVTEKSDNKSCDAGQEKIP